MATWNGQHYRFIVVEMFEESQEIERCRIENAFVEASKLDYLTTQNVIDL